MARSSGTYTAPTNSWNPAVEGTEIDEGDFNTLLDDIEAALTESTYTAGLGATDNRLVRTDGTDTKKLQGTGITVDDSDNVTGVASITATTVNVGNADTTLSRTGAGDIAVEGNAIYRAGGTDVPIADGGTGASTATAAFNALAPTTTQGDIIYHNGTNNVRLGAGTAGQVLTSGGAGANPSWGSAGAGDVIGEASSVDSEIALFNGTGGKTIKRASTTGLLKGTSGVLSAAVAGTDYYNPGGTDVAVADGGTGASTAAAGFRALAEGISSTQGAVLYRDGSQWTALSPGTSGQVLQSGGAGANPSWASVAGTGDVTAAASFGTDNRIVRSDGTGKGVQSSAVSIDDSGNVSGIVNAAMTGYYDVAAISSPASPSSGTVRVFAKTLNSVDRLMSRDSNGIDRFLESGLVPISTATASSSATIAFTGLDTTTFDTFYIDIRNLLAATDGWYMWARFGTGGTPTYLTTSYEWFSPLFGYTGSAFYSSDAASAVGSAITDRMIISSYGAAAGSNGVASGTGKKADFLVRICAAASRRPIVRSDYCYIRSSDNRVVGGFACGNHTSDQTITAIQFGMGSGNIASGDFTLFGLRKN